MTKLERVKDNVIAFFQRIQRASSWWLFIFKQPAWAADDYHYLVQTLKRQLREMAYLHDKMKFYGNYPHYVSRMNLVITLLDRWNEEYYSNKYYDEGRIKDNNWISPIEWKEGYSTEGWMKSFEQNQKAKDLAFKIMAQDIHNWWI